jgi:DNA-binding SARP family transcriptional activator
MRPAVLGPAAAERDGAPVDLGPRLQRALLAALALHLNRPVPADGLAELLWAGHPAPAAAVSLQS